MVEGIMSVPSDREVDGAIVTYLRTDIDCFACFEHVRQALLSQPDVETVEEDATVGCLVVTHRSNSEQLRRVVARVGHRLVMADNGELGMGLASATTAPDHKSCRGPERDEEVR